MIAPETLTKAQIQAWLDAKHGGNRVWLAEQTGNSVGTVGHWFSHRGFSDPARASIARLMELDSLAEQLERMGQSSQTLRFTTAEFEILDRARRVVGSPSWEEFYHWALVRYAEILAQGPSKSQIKYTPHPGLDEAPRAAEGGEEGLGDEG